MLKATEDILDFVAFQEDEEFILDIYDSEVFKPLVFADSLGLADVRGSLETAQRLAEDAKRVEKSPKARLSKAIKTQTKSLVNRVTETFALDVLESDNENGADACDVKCGGSTSCADECRANKALKAAEKALKKAAAAEKKAQEALNATDPATVEAPLSEVPQTTGDGGEVQQTTILNSPRFDIADANEDGLSSDEPTADQSKPTASPVTVVPESISAPAPTVPDNEEEEESDVDTAPVVDVGEDLGDATADQSQDTSPVTVVPEPFLAPAPTGNEPGGGSSAQAVLVTTSLQSPDEGVFEDLRPQPLDSASGR